MAVHISGWSMLYCNSSCSFTEVLHMLVTWLQQYRCRWRMPTAKNKVEQRQHFWEHMHLALYIVYMINFQEMLKIYEYCSLTGLEKAQEFFYREYTLTCFCLFWSESLVKLAKYDYSCQIFRNVFLNGCYTCCSTSWNICRGCDMATLFQLSYKP